MADEKDLEGDEPKGGKKKLIIIIAAVVLLLVVGGVAAWLLMGGDEPAADGEEAVAEEVVPKGPAIYHKMEPVFVVNLPSGGRAKMLQVEVDVLTYDPEVDAFLTQYDPMLRHHLFNLFSSQTPATLSSREGREALQAETKALLEKQMAEQGLESTIEAVYFTQFVLQ